MSDKVTVRLSRQEQRMFTAIRAGNRSDTVRRLIRRAYCQRYVGRGCFHTLDGVRVALEVKRDG